MEFKRIYKLTIKNRIIEFIDSGKTRHRYMDLKNHLHLIKLGTARAGIRLETCSLQIEYI